MSSKPGMNDHKVHLYQRIVNKKTGNTTFRCMKPGCTHWLPEVHINKKLCECYACGTVFTLTKKLLSNRVRFKCPDCRANIPMEKRARLLKTPIEKVKEEVISKDIIADVLDNLFGDLE